MTLSQKIEKHNDLVAAFAALGDAQKAKALSLSNSVTEMKSLLLQSMENYNISRQLKDSLFNEDNTKQIAEIKTKYETEKKDNEIVLLNKEKDLQKLSLSQQQAALLLSKLESEKNVSEIELLNKTKDIQELQLTKTQQDLLAQQLTTKAQTAQLEVEKKDKVLKEQQLSKEKLYRNILIVGSLAFALVGFLLFNRYTLNKKIEHQAVLINQRKHISADLHDDVGPLLATARLYLNENMINQEPAAQLQSIFSAKQIISNHRGMITTNSRPVSSPQDDPRPHLTDFTIWLPFKQP